MAPSPRQVSAPVSVRALLWPIAVLALAGCTAPSVPASHDTNGYADAVVVLGDSVSTAKNSDPARPEQDAPENSWATGTAPAVDSVYARLVAVNPRASGHRANLAVDSADVDGVLDQARRLAAHPWAHALVLLQGISAGLRCDGTDAANVGPFAQKVGRVIDTVAAAMPDADIVLVGGFGTARSYAEAMSRVDPGSVTGADACSPIDPATGRLDTARIAYAQSLVDTYEAKTAAVCRARPRCRTDGLAARSMPLVEADFVPYDIHLSVTGERDLAAALWRSVQPYSR